MELPSFLIQSQKDISKKAVPLFRPRLETNSPGFLVVEVNVFNKSTLYSCFYLKQLIHWNMLPLLFLHGVS